MDQLGKAEFPEVESGADTDQFTRRSSILKPQRRTSSASNPDITSKTLRRVSFASSNLIKPFAADPEKNTIWDTTYEEAVNHTDSTKSSSERTDLLNTTSMVLPDTENAFEGFVSFKPSCSKITAEISMDITACDKENPRHILETFGHVIAEELIMNKENICIPPDICSITSRGRDEHIEVRKPLRIGRRSESVTMEFTEVLSTEIISHEQCSSAILVGNDTKTDSTRVFSDLDGDLEFTATLQNSKAIIENTRMQEINITKFKGEKLSICAKNLAEESVQSKNVNAMNKTIHFNNSQGGLDFTSVLSLPKPRVSVAPTGILKNSSDKNQTYLYGTTEGEMELTAPIWTDTVLNHRRQTICFEEDMEITISEEMPVNTVRSGEFFEPYEDSIDMTSPDGNSNKSKEKTVIFTTSEGDMEFTSVLSAAGHVPCPTEDKRVETYHVVSEEVISTQEDDKENRTVLPLPEPISHANDSKNHLLSLQPFGNVTNLKSDSEIPKDTSANLKYENVTSLSSTNKFSDITEAVDGASDVKVSLIVDKEKIPSQTVQTDVDAALAEEDVRVDIQSISNQFQEENVIHEESRQKSPQASTMCVSNVVYSEPAKIKVNKAKFTPIAEAVSTPSSSFVINFTDMSPSTEDTQQLINAANFSRPESFKWDNFDTLNKGGVSVSKNEDEDCLIVDTTPALIEEGSLIMDSFVGVEGIEEPNVSNSGTDLNVTSSNYHNYTLRSHTVLSNIKKYLSQKSSDDTAAYERLDRSYETIKANEKKIKELKKQFRLPKIECLDLGKMFEEVQEEYKRCQVERNVKNEEEIKQNQLMEGLAVPKSLYERVCEAAKRYEKHWRFIKNDDDFYYFYALSGTVPFKVHVHPELGIVYSVQTYQNISTESKPCSFYDVNVFELKMKKENLLSALGTKYDILTLLDYVAMSVEEIVDFHVEFIELMEKYSYSHKLTMHPDFSVSFKILKVSLMIWWTITVKLSLINVGCAEDVSATCEIGEKLNEDNIKSIAQNTLADSKFLRNVIENTEEYVKRIGKRIKYKNNPHCKSAS